MTTDTKTCTWTEVLGTLLSGRSLDRGQASWAMDRIMEGETTPAQLGAFMAALRLKGESVEEIIGLVETMRRISKKVEVDYPVVDTCGTGGDRSGSVNVSTMAAMVVAGAGAKVAKHGNRAASSSCGSADVLEALGVKVDLGPEGVRRCLDEAGIGFCFAPVFHPSMRHVGPIRKELGVPTVFNFLGPLSNPAGARFQALGVSDKSMAPRMLEVLAALGSERVLIFRGFDGLDELSTTGPSNLWELEAGELSESVIDPLDYGIPRAAPSALAGGSAENNARVVREVLDGREGPDRDVVVLNSAAGLIAAGVAPGFAEGISLAKESLDSGRARTALTRLVEVSNS
ncbi:MAG TPA: anthranilate phosphoribosyltransferase [Actinomycetota bacterium]|nr:anthranilate phosphoribosyltransferase [Actinomycetota bacterium]